MAHTQRSLDSLVAEVLKLYPRIYFACHTRHVRDPETEKVLSAHQASILDHLDEIEPTTLMDLASHMGVTPSTMSLAIDRLVRMNYVERTRDDIDKRRVALVLTAAGLRIKSTKSVLDPERVSRMLSRLSGGERREAIHGLALLARAAKEEMAGKTKVTAKGVFTK